VTSSLVIGIITLALAVLWAWLATQAAKAWQRRAEAVENVLRLDRRKRSEAVSRGNKTKAENRRARAESGRPGSADPTLPFPTDRS